MNQDRFEGNWRQFGGKVKEQWGRLTNDPQRESAGRRDQRAGRIQERYGAAGGASKSAPRSRRKTTFWFPFSSQRSSSACR
jgi:uncharacterized protein YjbJ (UPF0337 family)